MDQEWDASGSLDGQQVLLANAGEDACAVRARVAAGDHADDRAWLDVIGHVLLIVRYRFRHSAWVSLGSPGMRRLYSAHAPCGAGGRLKLHIDVPARRVG